MHKKCSTSHMDGQTCATLRKMCVWRGVLSSLPVACTTHSLMSVREVCENNCPVWLWKNLQPSLFPPLLISPLRVWVFVLPTLLWRWWRGSLRPVSFPILAVPFQVCSQCFIEWSLACSILLRNIDVLSSSFVSKNCEILRGRLKKIFSRSHRSSLHIINLWSSKMVFSYRFRGCQVSL